MAQMATKISMRGYLGLIVSLIVAYAAAIQPKIQTNQKPEGHTRFTRVEYHMGINARLVVYAKNEESANLACEAAFKRMAELDGIMSDYRPKSELMLFCANPKNTIVKLSPDLFKVLERSQLISKQSDGAFDCTVGPLVQLWRTARKEAKLQSPQSIDEAKSRVGFKFLHLNRRTRTASLDKDGMKLDLGGIAKGYASDEALKTLKKHGVKSALIEMGGDLVLGDPPPNEKGWRVQIPNAATEVLLKNCAVSSSGDTEQYVVINGTRYSHVVDPKTGQGLSQRVQSTVIARDGFTTDPLSTALTVLDDSGRAKLLKHYPKSQAFIKKAQD